MVFFRTGLRKVLNFNFLKRESPTLKLKKTFKLFNVEDSEMNLLQINQFPENSLALPLIKFPLILNFM